MEERRSQILISAPALASGHARKRERAPRGVLVKLAWHDRREDVLTALECLAAEPPGLSGSERDPRWPDVTNAIHWIIDDTSWDRSDPSASIGWTLHNEGEASAMRRVVESVLAVAGRLRPEDADRLWFDDAHWSGVRSAADEALDVLRSTDRT